MKHRYIVAIFLAILIGVSGCAYTTASLLPSNYKFICVDNFSNKIKVTAEQSNERMYRGYKPGMEIELTKAVIDRFIFDGNLRTEDASNANIILSGELIDFRRDPLRYDKNDNVQEYRIKIIVNIKLKDVRTDKVLWTENGFSGETTYTTTGSLAESDDTAIRIAIEDLARRIVERTVEAW